MDAEVVEVSRVHRQPIDGSGQAQEERASPNQEIKQALNDLGPVIARVTKEVLAAEAAASRHRDTVLPQLRSNAQSRIFGVLALFSFTEVNRQRLAQEVLQSALIKQAGLDEEASRARAALEAALGRRKALYAAYPGNQARAQKRQNRRAKYGF